MSRQYHNPVAIRYGAGSIEDLPAVLAGRRTVLVTFPEAQGLGLPSEGTLSIAVSLAGDDEANPFGVRGRSDVAENALGGESLPGHGQHGGLGHYEQRPFLAVRAAGIARGTYATAASLIDLAPTILRHLALPRDGMDGSALPTR